MTTTDDPIATLAALVEIIALGERTKDIRPLHTDPDTHGMGVIANDGDWVADVHANLGNGLDAHVIRNYLVAAANSACALAERVMALEADNARLRAALEGVNWCRDESGGGDRPCWCTRMDYRDPHTEACLAARAALEPR